MPIVTVIMPVYNVEKYLRKSVESVLGQTFKDFELILVDDGSPDGCPAICDAYAAQDTRVRVIHKTNGGLSSARNAGIESAKGLYILFLDSDDDIEKDTLEKCWTYLRDNAYDLLIFGYRVIYENETQSIKTVIPKTEDYFGQKAIQLHFIELSRNGFYNFAWGKLYRLEVIKNNNVKSDSFFDKTNEDTVFLLRLFPYLNSVALIDTTLQNYYIRAGQSVTKRFVPQRYYQFYGKFLILKELLDGFEVRNSCNDEYIYSEYCKSILWAYEFMFHKDCKLGVWEGRKYIKKTFSISNESVFFRVRAAKYFIKTREFAGISRMSKVAVILILFRFYFMTWLCHSIVLFKLR